MKLSSIPGICFRDFPDHNEPMPPLQSYKARDGIQLNYRSYEGQNKNNVIVLYHGTSAHGKYLHHLAKYLSGDKKLGQVLVPNLRGHYALHDAAIWDDHLTIRRYHLGHQFR